MQYAQGIKELGDLMRAVDFIRHIRGMFGDLDMPESEPLFEIEETGDDPGGYDYEIWLSDEVAHTRSAKVDRVLRKLSREEGVEEVIREDREMILVRAPKWSAEDLETWMAYRI